VNMDDVNIIAKNAEDRVSVNMDDLNIIVKNAEEV